MSFFNLDEKHINAIILLVLLLLAVRVLINFNRQKQFYDKFMDSLNGGEIYRKMIEISSSPASALSVTVSSETQVKKCEDKTTNDKNYPFKFIKGRKFKKSGMNNCLFDAVIEGLRRSDRKDALPTEDSQKLREMCDEVLEKEGFPLIPHGEPAGEQYIQALSKILGFSIKVHKDHPNNFVADVKHSDVGDEAPNVSIVHLGAEDFGHWVCV